MTQMDDKKLILDIQDLTIHYVVESGTVHAVENLNLSLGYGENLGFVGETGAGKTTAALGIMGLVPNPPGKVMGGKVIFEGEDLLQKTESQMREIRGGKISMIFQDPMTSLNPVMTVDKQIAEMVLLHNDVTEQQALDRAVEMLEMVGIKKERAKDFPHQFSGGMKQRVVIAIALACNPALLIADEPTTALDVTIQAQVLELMRELRRKINTSLIMITHDLGIVAEMCDKVAIMYAGKVVEYASTEALFNRPAHPYTEGLFNSIPDLTEDREELKVIKGLMPDPTNIPSGCSFHPRCPYAVDTCSQSVPKMVEIEPGHFVACPIWGNKLLRDSAATEVK